LLLFHYLSSHFVEEWVERIRVNNAKGGIPAQQQPCPAVVVVVAALTVRQREQRGKEERG
jgi:hypothetical protein